MYLSASTTIYENETEDLHMVESNLAIDFLADRAPTRSMDFFLRTLPKPLVLHYESQLPGTRHPSKQKSNVLMGKRILDDSISGPRLSKTEAVQ